MTILLNNFMNQTMDSAEFIKYSGSYFMQLKFCVFVCVPSTHLVMRIKYSSHIISC